MTEEEKRFSEALRRKEMYDRLPDPDFSQGALIRWTSIGYTRGGQQYWRYAEHLGNNRWTITGFTEPVSWAWLTERWLQDREVQVEVLNVFVDDDEGMPDLHIWDDILKPEKKEEKKIDTKMRRFQMHRDNVVIAEGVRFSYGQVAVRWLTDVASTVIWEHIEDLISVANTHDTTALVWIDEEQN